MTEIVIYYTETKGKSAGHIFPYCFVEHLSQAEIDAKVAQLRSEGYQNLVVASYQEYEKAAKQASYVVYKAYIAQPSDEETFKSMFNILPPQDHTSWGSTELFRMSEQLDAGLYNFFVRIADQYFKVVAFRNANKDELIKLCQPAIAA